MAELQQLNGRPVIDYMARDYDSLLRAMRELIPDKLPEWTDYESEADFGNVLLQLFAHMGDILSYYQDRIANESFLGTAQTRRSIIHHLRLVGYRLATAAPASATLRLLLPAACTETVTIQKGDAFATPSLKDRPSVRFEYTRDEKLSVDGHTLPLDGATGKKYLDIPVEEGRLIANEILGVSDGSRYQRFALAHPGVILRSLDTEQAVNRDILLLTTLGTVTEEWFPRESLVYSAQGQREYTVEVDEEDRATLRFGDGVFGLIPPRGATLAATYRVGGGSHGNVAANAIRTIVDAPHLALLGAEVRNSARATGGAERESIEHAVRHAPHVFRSLKRAVTAEDYEALARNYKGVGKVRAEASNWSQVILNVAPAGGGPVSDVLRASLLTYFEDKRPVTTLVKVQDVDYVSVYITAEVGVKRYYVPESVREQVRRAAGSLLDFANVDFGRPLYISKFYEAIEAIAGVDYVTITEFQARRAGQAPPLEPVVESSGIIELQPNEIPQAPDDTAYARSIKVVFAGEQPSCA